MTLEETAGNLITPLGLYGPSGGFCVYCAETRLRSRDDGYSHAMARGNSELSVERRVSVLPLIVSPGRTL